MTDIRKPLPKVPHADDIADALFEDESPRGWQAAAATIGDNFARIRTALTTLPVPHDDEDDAVTQRREDLQEFVESYIERMDAEGWENERKHYTLGRIDTEALIAAARQEMIDWEDVLYAKAMAGSAEDVRAVVAAGRAAQARLDLDTALAWAAEPAALTADLRHSGNCAAAEALLSLGARPSYNDGDLFFRVLREGRVDIARAFARAGVDDDDFDLDHWHHNARDWLDDDRAARRLLRDMYWEYGRYTLSDPATLTQWKDTGDGSGLKVIFDFAARRVSEIYTARNQILKTEISFDDYGPAAIEAARAKLTELGGRPPEDDTPAGYRPLAKPRLSPPGKG